MKDAREASAPFAICHLVRCLCFSRALRQEFGLMGACVALSTAFEKGKSLRGRERDWWERYWWERVGGRNRRALRYAASVPQPFLLPVFVFLLLEDLEWLVLYHHTNTWYVPDTCVGEVGFTRPLVAVAETILRAEKEGAEFRDLDFSVVEGGRQTGA